MDQADDDVGHNVGRASFAEFSECLESLVGLIAQIANETSFLRVLFPQWKVSYPKEIAVIGQELLQAGPSDVHELDLCLF